MEETIDILMATYNGEKYIKEQIESILAQDYSNIRCIICDDCSTDRTYEIAKEYVKKDKRVIVYKNEKNLGVIKNFEKLLSLVESDYYMLADQDDIWKTTKVSDTFQKLKKENADLVFTDLEIVDENMQIKNHSFNRVMGIYPKISKEKDIRLVYLYNVVTGCTILTKKKYISKILPLPTNKDVLHDHYIALATLLSGGKVCYLDKPTIFYRQHQHNQVGTSRYTDRFKTFQEVRNHLIQVKISIFTTYCQMNALFDDVYQKKNNEALQYFSTIKKNRYINLRGSKFYFSLYKDEKLSKKLLYFTIFHIPCIGRIGYLFKGVLQKHR